MRGVTSPGKHSGRSPPGLLYALCFPHRLPLLFLLYGHAQLPEYPAMLRSTRICRIASSDGFSAAAMPNDKAQRRIVLSANQRMLRSMRAGGRAIP